MELAVDASRAVDTLSVDVVVVPLTKDAGGVSVIVFVEDVVVVTDEVLSAT